MKKNSRRMELLIAVKILNKEPGDDKIEKMLTREATSWVKFLLSPKGIELLHYIYGKNRPIKITKMGITE